VNGDFGMSPFRGQLGQALPADIRHVSTPRSKHNGASGVYFALYALLSRPKTLETRWRSSAPIQPLESERRVKKDPRKHKHDSASEHDEYRFPAWVSGRQTVID
jgi:hypothetical protein